MMSSSASTEDVPSKNKNNTNNNDDDDDRPSLIEDSLAGLTVAFSLLSKAIACSTIVGVNPLVGIWSSVVMGITSPLCEFLDIEWFILHQHEFTILNNRIDKIYQIIIIPS